MKPSSKNATGRGHRKSLNLSLAEMEHGWWEQRGFLFGLPWAGILALVFLRNAIWDKISRFVYFSSHSYNEGMVLNSESCREKLNGVI